MAYKWIFPQNNSTSLGEPSGAIYIPALQRLTVDTFYPQLNSLHGPIFVKSLLYLTRDDFQDEGCLRANIEDNLKLGLKSPIIYNLP